MTWGAILERDTFILDGDFPRFQGQVALIAPDLFVSSVKIELCLLVIELRGALPVPFVVTASAITRELSLMGVPMTAGTVARQSEESTRQVPCRNDLFLGLNYMSRLVASAAKQLGVPAIQAISYAAVIKLAAEIASVV